MWAGSGKPAGQGVPSLGAEAARNRRIFILSAHVCSPATRKTSVHFIAENWARAGHEVHFTTVGYSWLSALKRSERFHHLRRNQYNRYTRQAENLNAGSYLPLVHGFSSSNPVLRPLIAPLLRAYGRHLPGFIVSTVAGSDLIVLESGTPLVFFDLLRRLNPSARMLYLCRDLLKTVGAAEAIREIERARIASFDAVCVPSRKLGTLLPPGGNVVCVPQGVERDIFDDAGSSPYPAGTRNAVIAGDMLFDRAAVASMAEAVPEVNFHLFGVPWHGPVPGNVRLYGEQPFDVLAALFCAMVAFALCRTIGGGAGIFAAVPAGMLAYAAALRFLRAVPRHEILPAAKAVAGHLPAPLASALIGVTKFVSWPG